VDWVPNLSNFVNPEQYRERLQASVAVQLMSSLVLKFGRRMLVFGFFSSKVPLQAWRGPGGSRKLRLPDFMTTAQDGGEVVSLTHRPPLPSGNTPGTHFC